MEPMLLKPVGKDYLWGGTRLRYEYGKRIDMTPLAETWECSAHPDGPSTIVNGEFAGQKLNVVLKTHPEFLGTKVPAGSGLPILVKLIDAEKNLSIQVHPDDEYAREYEHQNGKTEMWYVLDAKQGATLMNGFAHPVTKEQLESAVKEGQLTKHLQKVKVHKDDVFYIPAGTVHAIGAGIILAEVQESSNVTYRVYDYDREDKNGNKRELHFEKAVQVMDVRPGTEVRRKARVVHYHPGCSRELLCRCPYFEVERIQVLKGFSFSVLSASFQVILCLDGEGGLEAGGQERPIRFSKGSCIFLPAGLERCHVIGDTTLLKVRC